MRWIALGIVLLGSGLAGADELRHSDPSRRAAAARKAGERFERAAVPVLIDLLSDESAAVRLEAVRALATLRSAAALRALLVRAQIDPDARVRAAAARAVRRLDSKAFVAKLASSNPPPVDAKPLPPLRPRARRAVLLSLGTAANSLRFGDSFGGNAGFGLRWDPIEAQIAVGYPAMSLSARLRWLIISYPRLTPFVTLGGAISYNNGVEELPRPSESLLAGVGLRYYIIPPIYFQLELLACWSFHSPRSARGYEQIDPRSFSLPLLLEAGLELWP